MSRRLASLSLVVVFLLVLLPYICQAAVAQAPGLLTVPAANATGNYTIRWQASKTAGAKYQLMEAKDPTFAQATTVYSGTGLFVALKGKAKGATYYYRVRATKSGLDASGWRSGTNGCAVPGTVKSNAPSSLTVPLYDANGAYAIRWTASSTAKVQYVLEEATDTDFTKNRRVVYVGTALNKALTGRADEATYFYRVRAIKAGVQDSAWRQGKNGCGVPGTALARKFLGAVASCGSLSPNTVPDTWGIAALRSTAEGKYCATWIPPFWESSYLGEGGSFFSNQAGTSGVAIMTGVPYGIQACTPQAYANWYIALMTTSGNCTNPKMEYYEEGTANYFGTVYQTATYVFTCTKGGSTIVAGAYSAVTSGPYGICSTINLAQWVPSTFTNATVCTNAQILSGQKCAAVNSEMCEKPVCSKNCKAQGSTGGHCDSFENCVCH